MNRRTALFLGMVMITITLVSLSIALWHFGTQEPAADSIADRTPQRIGILTPLDPAQPAPEAVLVMEDGRQVTLAELTRGQLTVVNLWATWCMPCMREMPSLDRLRQVVASEDITVLAISEDATLEQARAFLIREKLIGLGLYHDPRGRLAQAFGVQGLPSTYILQASGRVVARLEGEAEWDSPTLIAHLKSLATMPPAWFVLPREHRREAPYSRSNRG